MKTTKNEFPRLPDRIAGLGELAENLWWSWNPAARMLFKSLDRQAWKESVHNPDKMLKELPKEILERAATDNEYLRNYDVALSQFEKSCLGRFPESANQSADCQHQFCAELLPPPL